MNYGKKKCEFLKSVRKRIADTNNIPYSPKQCTHEGECKGTCPACESEARYIEKQLDIRRLTGNVVKIVGVSTIISLSACTPSSTNVTSNTPIETTETNDTDHVDLLELTNTTPDIIDEPIVGEIDPIDKIDEPIIDKKAEYPGGTKALLQYLKDNLRYPKEAINKNIQGTVIVDFNIDIDGIISDVKVIRSVDPILDEEAIRVVEAMGYWTPAIADGKEVRSRFKLPIRFTLKK